MRNSNTAQADECNLLFEILIEFVYFEVRHGGEYEWIDPKSEDEMYVVMKKKK
jgi:hypothetical protein